MREIDSIIHQMESDLRSAAQPTRAVQAEAYMKNHFRYFGMDAQTRRNIQLPFIKSLKNMEDREERWELMHALWEKEEREFQYFAIDWLNSWPKNWIQMQDAIELKRLISTKSWWDSVDAIASNYLGKWAKLYKDHSRLVFDDWLGSGNIWLQRSCLIYQLKYNKETDVAHLESVIVSLLPIKEFFIQKAIGWSLRQLSKSNPRAVEHLLEIHPITGLAKREASKYL